MFWPKVNQWLICGGSLQQVTLFCDTHVPQCMVSAYWLIDHGLQDTWLNGWYHPLTLAMHFNTKQPDLNHMYNQNNPKNFLKGYATLDWKVNAWQIMDPGYVYWRAWWGPIKWSKGLLVACTLKRTIGHSQPIEWKQMGMKPMAEKSLINMKESAGCVYLSINMTPPPSLQEFKMLISLFSIVKINPLKSTERPPWQRNPVPIPTAKWHERQSRAKGKD